MKKAIRTTARLFTEIAVGEKVRRNLGGATMELVVTSLDEHFIHCGPWKFDRLTGAEVDEEIGWGPQFGVTGSYLELPLLTD
jgi:hypothetical protein